MARRKQKYLSDGSDSEDADELASDGDFDSQEDDDSRAERRLFERRQRKRPRTGQSGKDAAWEGVLGGGADILQRSFGSGAGDRGAAAGSGSRSDWTKVPTFVVGRKDASHASPFEEPVTAKAGDESKGAQDYQSQDEESSSSEDESRSASSRATQLDDGDTRSRRSGSGGKRTAASKFLPQGSSSKPDEAVSGDYDAPSTFGRRAAAYRSSVSQLANTERSNFQSSRSSTPAPAPKPADLSTADKAHLGKISGSFGASMLRKFGWTPGKGLGLSEDGRAVPIAVGMLNRGEGIKSGIRTEDSKREARRKGDVTEDEDQVRSKPPKGKGAKQSHSDGWRKHKRVKVKVEHKTYEQLIAEEDTTRAGVGLVLDARGGELKAVESLSELSISGWTPSSDVSQLPELRHNLRLILDLAKGSVGNLVKEGKSVNERRRWTVREAERSRQKLDGATEDLQRLGQVRSLVSKISALSNQVARSGTPSMAPLESPLNHLVTDFKDEYLRLSLDEVVVGSIDLVLRSAFLSWKPFDLSSDALLSALKPWRPAFNLDVKTTSSPDEGNRVMTAWESLLWHRWLPKVRSAINNEWTPEDPWPAVHLVESWEPLLPDFIRDNVVDQLVLPKVMEGVKSWSDRAGLKEKPSSLASMVFPWLPLLGDRHGEVLEESKRRIRSLLRRWRPADGVPRELLPWRNDIFSSHEWDVLMREHVLGRLGSTLRELVINPRDQDMTAVVEYVLPWHSLIRPSNFARLFELEFFPKWLDVLYLWLVHPGYNGEEVAQWFEMWKSLFPADVRSHKAISHGFEAGVKLMDEALALGPSASKELQRPTYSPLSKSSRTADDTTKAKDLSTPRRSKVVQRSDITFRNVAEDYISSKDLLMVPIGRSHDTTGKPLFRVGKTIDGRGGITVYVGEDAVFAEDEPGVFRATALEDIVKRAGGM